MSPGTATARSERWFRSADPQVDPDGVCFDRPVWVDRGPSFDTSIIEGPEAFDAIRDDWTALLGRSLSNSVTLTWPWLRTWWDVFGDDERQLRIVCVRENGRLIGAAPMLTRRRRQVRYRVLPFRRMELVASGEARADQICSDYLDWIAETGREVEAVRAILGCLDEELGGEWDELVLPDVPAESPNLRRLEKESAGRGLRLEILTRESCSICRLPDSWDQFLRSASPGLRYKIRRGRRELEQAGGSYTVVTNERELPEAIETLVALHQQRWTAKGRPGAFKSERRRRFHEVLMRRTLDAGWLRLGVLRTADEPIGAIYNFRYAGRVYFYQSGITVPSNTHLRPGILLHGYEIEDAIRARCSEYDFLKRGHSDYKDAWADASRDLLCVRIARPSVKEAALTGLRAAHDALRTVKRRLTRK